MSVLGSKNVFDKYAFSTEQLDLEQALIHKKDRHNAYSVERTYVNSKQYHDKFEKLPTNKEVQQSLYKEAGRLLNYVDAQEQDARGEPLWEHGREPLELRTTQVEQEQRGITQRREKTSTVSHKGDEEEHGMYSVHTLLINLQ